MNTCDATIAEPRGSIGDIVDSLRVWNTVQVNITLVTKACILTAVVSTKMEQQLRWQWYAHLDWGPACKYDQPSLPR